jgi:hypothetical protein
MELPVVRTPTEEELKSGKICQACHYWTRMRHSYGQGICALGWELSAPPRWAYETQVCDSFKRD